MILSVYADGGSRGNPGPSGIGVVVKNKKGVIFQLSRYIGRATNNEAEYQGLLAALDWLLANASRGQFEKIDFYLDSKLLVNQMAGKFRVKAANLKKFYFSAKEKERQLGIKIDYHAIPRERNTQADALANEAMDQSSA